MTLADAEGVEQAAVDPQLDNRSEPDAETDHRKPKEVPLEAGGRILLIVREIDAAIDEHTAPADGFRVLCDEGTLLRVNQRAVHERDKEGEGERCESFHRLLIPVASGFQVRASLVRCSRARLASSPEIGRSERSSPPASARPRPTHRAASPSQAAPRHRTMAVALSCNQPPA